MNVRRAKTLLWLTNVALGTVAASILTCAILWPVGTASEGEHEPPQQSIDVEGTDDPTHPLSYYSVIWQRDLRGPLWDPPPRPVAQRPKPTLAVTLTGTIVEPGFTYATFTLNDGSTVLRRVGQEVAGAEIKTIVDGEVRVLFAGEYLTLELKRKKERP